MTSRVGVSIRTATAMPREVTEPPLREVTA